MIFKNQINCFRKCFNVFEVWLTWTFLDQDSFDLDELKDSISEIWLVCFYPERSFESEDKKIITKKTRWSCQSSDPDSGVKLPTNKNCRLKLKRRNPAVRAAFFAPIMPELSLVCLHFYCNAAFTLNILCS